MAVGRGGGIEGCISPEFLTNFVLLFSKWLDTVKQDKQQWVELRDTCQKDHPAAFRESDSVGGA